VLLIGIITTQASQVAEVYTAIISGGVLLFLLSFSGWIKFLQRVFTVRIVIVILALIAFTLAPTILNLLFSDKANAFFSLYFFWQWSF
jgi:xanthine/uracil permease